MENDIIFGMIGEKINEAKSIAILCHIRPDGDTLGSALALKNALKHKECFVYCDDAISQKFDFLKGFYDIRGGEIGSHDLIICVDCSDLGRLGSYSSAVKYHENTVNIDHHISNEEFAHINCVLGLSSTCEIIFNLIKFMGIEPDADVYKCIFCGLSTDTGNFSHSNTTHTAFAVASELVRLIGDISFITQRLYKDIPKSKLLLLGHALSNIKFYIGDKMAILTILLEDLERFGCASNDTEGFVDYAINIVSVEVGAILLECEKGRFKVSLRSKSADVCKIAAQFGGGGHTHASGCMLFGDYEEVVDKLVRNAEFYI
ncbi:MAG: bifunctional oligoribonuclease/PAP phosphatase NrnA [Clostridiales bacterium]|jgi:phosphoesterase RecJ-like protein|nr:bifunctional oligoribonuclease/PAP phosphatase NrnA [Clostridiales bacterium]